jgi:hypothetical protein
MARDRGRKKARPADDSTLPGFVAPLRLVDDVDTALATHEAIVAMAVAQGFQRITDFHDSHQKVFPRGASPLAANQGGARMPQTKPMIKGVEPFGSAGLVSD